MQSSRIGLRTLHTASRALPSAAYVHPLIASIRRPQQVRHISFGFDVLRNLLPKRQKEVEPADKPADGVEAAVVPKASAKQQAEEKGLFDVATEEEDVREAQGRFGLAPKPMKHATYHKSSTANFKVSRRRLADLSRLIAGRTADEAILQLQASQKKNAPRLLSMVALARDHAMAKGLKREKLVIAQSWVTKGVYLKRIDIKGRGRFGVKHHPSAKLHVLLAEGRTEEERRREKQQAQWRKKIRNSTEAPGFALATRARPLINNNGAQWKW
ncbi:50S ribosomal protein l22 [Rhodotorula toruloides]|uniref:50S ribosomal protein l22 n=1 Tax=Rhodotorula toruloides TaxID=5286 RepID=A0A511KKX0_RHOTO|nr:50S ribosomal protein l22 [Rhodotorula toruloides]